MKNSEEIENLQNLIAASTPGGIETQERSEQQSFVGTDTLPKEMLHGCTKKKLKAMGIQFGKDYDDLFVNVILPAGWKKQAEDHAMWSKLLDDKGRERASMFYKGAFYDRKAHISLTRRFSVSCDPEDNYKSDIGHEKRRAGNWYVVVTDGKEIIFKTDPIKNPDYDKEQELRGIATKWLEEKYPDYENDLAYWD